MNRFQQTLGRVCDHCPLCNYARKNPEKILGRTMSWHGRYCPAWKAQQQIARERNAEKQKGTVDGEKNMV